MYGLWSKIFLLSSLAVSPLSLLHTFSFPLSRPRAIKPQISAMRSSQHVHQKGNRAPFPFHLFARASRVTRVAVRERMFLLGLKSVGVCVIRNIFISVSCL